MRAVSLRAASAAAWGELGEEAAAEGRAGPEDGGALRAGAGAMAPVLNLNNEVSHLPRRPLGWPSGGRLGGLSRGRPGGAGGGGGRWRGPGHREGREVAELCSGVSPCERAGPGRTRPDPPQGRRGCPERWGRPRGGRGCRRRLGKRCALCWLSAKGLGDENKDLSCEDKLPLGECYAIVDTCASVQHPLTGSSSCRVMSYPVCVHAEVLQVVLVDLLKFQLPVSWVAKVWRCPIFLEAEGLRIRNQWVRANFFLFCKKFGGSRFSQNFFPLYSVN